MIFYKLIQLYTCGLLVASVSSINQLFYWQQQLVSREPLLRFPFISYLVDPCGSESKSDAIPPFLVMTDTPLDRTNLPGMRTLAADVPVAKHSFSFLSRFQDRYVFPFNYTKEDRHAIAQEFWLVLNEARGLVRRIYSPAEVLHCQGIQLQSLPDLSTLLTQNINAQLREIYRGLMVTAGHLHLILRDVVDSTRNCPSESHAKHEIIHLLSGKIETLMCLILQLGNNSDEENYFEIAYQVLQTVVYRYFDCSAREMRSCLVIEFADRILHTIHSLIENADLQDKFGFDINH